MNKRTVLTCVLGAMAATASHATPTTVQTTEIRVRYDHRELASPAGARHLLRRIGKAALESCGASSFSLSDVKTAAMASPCWKDAVDDAVRRIHDPMLTATAHQGSMLTKTP
jgi:UrcA family protein